MVKSVRKTDDCGGIEVKAETQFYQMDQRKAPAVGTACVSAAALVIYVFDPLDRGVTWT